MFDSVYLRLVRCFVLSVGDMYNEYIHDILVLTRLAVVENWDECLLMGMKHFYTLSHILCSFFSLQFPSSLAEKAIYRKQKPPFTLKHLSFHNEKS